MTTKEKFNVDMGLLIDNINEIVDGEGSRNYSLDWEDMPVDMLAIFIKSSSESIERKCSDGKSTPKEIAADLAQIGIAVAIATGNILRSKK